MPRTVGRVNHPNNEWLFTEAWGVDVNVSTPRIMSALVEEAVTVGDLVRLFTFRQGNANLVEMTLPADSPYVGKPAGLIPFPENCALVTILRDGQVYTPDAEQPVEAGDELLFVVAAEVEDDAPGAALPRHRRVATPATERRADGVTSARRSARHALPRASLDRGVVAGQQPDHRGQRGELQRPAHRDLEDAEAATAVSGSIVPDLPASQIGACTAHPQDARQQRAARSGGGTAARPAGPGARRSGRR